MERNPSDEPRVPPQVERGDEGGVIVNPPSPGEPGPPQRLTMADVERIVREAVEGRSSYILLEQGRSLLASVQFDLRRLEVKIDEMRGLLEAALPQPTPPPPTTQTLTVPTTITIETPSSITNSTETPTATIAAPTAGTKSKRKAA